MSMSKYSIISKLEDNKAHLKNLGVSSIELFGSYASGVAKNESDIDFLVSFTKGRGNYKDKLRLLHLLEDLFGKKIDLGEKGKLRKEIQNEVEKNATLKANI